MTDLEKEELEALKLTATNLGISYSPNIGLKTLKEKIATKQAEVPAEEVKEEAPSTKVSNDFETLRKQAMKLVRVSVRCNNPNKADYTGEYFTVANKIIGKVTKFVPYDGSPWEVPQCIYNQLINRKYVQYGQDNAEASKWVPELSIQVLPQLTAEELAQLAKEQAAGNRVD